MYDVSYSGYVTDEIRLLVKRNAARTAELLVALREFDKRLRVYPQFGQPLRDLVVKPLQLWVGVVPPLVFYYVLDEAQRRVMVVRPPIPLPRTNLV